MKPKLTLLVTVLAAALFGVGCANIAESAVKAKSSPPSNTFEFKNHRYLILHSAKGFLLEDAKKIAQALGGHLPYVETKAENDFIRGILTAEKYGPSVPLGATDAHDEGSWKWYNGQPIKWTDWATDQPGNSGNEDNLELTTPSNKRWKSGTWNDCDHGWLTIVIEWE